jgi:hypothetical protein
MTEYLGFVDLIGRTIDGNYIYRFDFTTDIDVVWGEFFNVTPSAIIPDLQPDINCLTKQAKVIFPKEMIIAKKNYCFSMQDCIDGIIPLIFTEIDYDVLEYDDKPFFIHFGKEYSDVEKYLDLFNLKMYDIVDISQHGEDLIDELIDSIGDNDDNDMEDF